MEGRKEYAKYAGFRVRFAAMLIDVVILVILFSIPVGFIYGQEYWQGEKLIYGFWDVLINYVIPAILTIFFWIVFSDKKQAWHDILAGTVVVRSESKGPFEFKSE